MSQLTNNAEDKLVDAIRGAAITFPTNLYLALHTGDPGEAGTANELAAAGAYARGAITMGASSGGVSTNTADYVSPTATANWGEVSHGSIWDISSGGTSANVWYKGPLWQSPQPFVAVASSDILYCPGHGYANDTIVIVDGDPLPTGLTSQKYYVITSTTDTFQLSLTQGGAAVNITANGSGLVGLYKGKTINTDDALKIATGNLSYSLK